MVTDELQRLVDEGFQKFCAGEWDGVEELCEKARRLRPDSGLPLVLEGGSRLMQGRLPEAREKLLEALEVEPACAQAYEALASMLGVFRGDHVCALQCLLYALQLKPDRQRTWCLLLKELAQLEIPRIVHSAAAMAFQRATGETEADFELRCAIHQAVGHHKELADEAERFVDRFPSSRAAEMYGLMIRLAGETEKQPFGETPEEEECDESGLGEVIRRYSESFQVGEDVRLEIAHMWDRFLSRGIAAPEV